MYIQNTRTIQSVSSSSSSCRKKEREKKESSPASYSSSRNHANIIHFTSQLRRADGVIALVLYITTSVHTGYSP